MILLFHMYPLLQQFLEFELGLLGSISLPLLRMFSIVHWLFGLILIGARYIGRTDILKTLLSAMGPQLNSVNDIVWKRVNFFIAFGFILLGFINLYIMKSFDLDFWVNFKLYGVLIYNLALMTSATFYLISKADKDVLPDT